MTDPNHFEDTEVVDVMTLETAFPGHIYGKYKRATRFFLDWVLRAHSATSARRAHDSASVQELNDVVMELVTQPKTLRPQLRKELPLALAACQVVITLREHVARFFPFKDASDTKDTHAYFLDRLKKWHTSLTALLTTCSSKGEQEEEFEVHFNNYYEVLAIPEDFFPEVDTIDIDERKTSSPSDAERKQLFDEAFAHSLKMDMSFFLMELEELSDAVYKVYCDVKFQKKTLIEASAVVKVAIQCATSALRVSSCDIHRFATPWI
ncbi:hypothetical protein Poli38472_014434 [Pythium oligandrum]|uniref:DUF6604 domain-containing protein n=1 Tax=Pythium oligandrum TaxID=41045 RepID=A0A8K1C736_PYTOL|nr:hypothetical protein Poli38472_014434 [Pythium oligandrum]|eukprot:TMW57831.1 hypothetical protein Poli38472_014434 [Pythium oligandrum]